MQSLLKAIASCEFDQSLLSPYLFSPLFFKTKKGESDVFVWHFYGRFLSINRASTTATTMIRTNKPAIAGTKYVLATDVGVAVGAAVAEGAFCTIILVSAFEPQ
jgi:hypothetical protein